MYRFIVIDDEYYVRQRVKNCIDWESLGFAFAGEAGSVNAALELLEGEHVQLAVVDITMPGENGLEFIRRARKKSPGTICIVLSGYSDFEFARSAMRYGVESYLTKPVNRDEMDQAVRRAAEILSQTKHEEEDLFLHNFFQRGQHFDAAEAAEQFQGHGVVPDRQYTVLVCDFATSSICSNNYDAQHGMRQTAISSLLCALSGRFETVVLSNSFRHIILIVGELDKKTPLNPLLKDVISRIRGESSNPFYIGRGCFLPGTPGNLLEAYREAELAFLSKVLHPDAESPLEFHAEPVDTLTFEPLNQRIEAALYTKNSTELLAGVETVFAEIMRKNISIQLLEFELSQLLTTAKTFAAKQKSVRLQISSHLLLLGCHEMIDASSNLNDVCVRVKELFLPLIDTQAGVGAITGIVHESAKMIGQLYKRSDFGLDILAAQLFVSPSYLSHVFKKSTGFSIVQYITKLRMEEAKKNLLAGNGSSVEIAEAVGFNDSSYFSKCFKKYFGVSPSKFRAAE